MKALLTALAWTFIGGLAAAASAQGTAGSGASPMQATLACRVANADETANAAMLRRPISLVCKSIDDGVPLSRIGETRSRPVAAMGPNVSSALTPQQLDAAWRSYLSAMFEIAHAGP